ncbi:MAG: DUF433 domain-containing protein [Dyadobacter sp.]|uniref:DUF433 domain-containing protein n=1 Tax=Dyadobacter sp. TaxID=1914288 RepID=UPI001AFDC0CC|nr:DUF433 domain-containing protein [Dyadobacter sp.]MBO9614308.1 DUF433 domain-containing protein [Dyadobacter sp.]
MPFEDQELIGIGTGVYTLTDISTILGLTPAKVSRWINEYWNLHFSKTAQPSFTSGAGRDRVTNFLTLIEFFTFYQLREEGVSAQRIVKAHHILAKTFQTPYPFAKSQILTDGKAVLFSGEVGNIIHADETLQIAIKEILSPFCKKVDFNQNDMAARFFPMGRNHDVVIDPKRQFGQPIIEGTNILTETIFNLFRGGESVSMISRLYNLKPGQVNDAINYHRAAA